MTSRADSRLLAALIIVATIALACAAPVLPEAVSVAGAPLPPPTPTAAPTPTPPPTPTPIPESEIGSEITLPPTPTAIPVPGLTATTMRLGVIADIKTSDIAENLSQGAWDGATAWAQAVNEKGGLAERAVELVLYDAELLFHRDAALWMCSNDIFALVGSKAVGDGNGVAEMTSNACGIPDFPATAFMSERRDSRLTWESNPHPSPFYQAGPLRWLGEEFPEAAAASSTIILGLPSIRVEREQMREAATGAGFNFVYDPLVAFDEDLSVSTYVTEMESAGVESLVWIGYPEALNTLLRAKAFTSAPPLDFVLCGPDCYTNEFITQGGGVAEGVIAWIPHLPFTEPAEAPEMINYLFGLNRALPQAIPSSQGLSAWSAGLLFEEAVERAIGAGTPAYDPSALTRESLGAAANTIDEWTARGIYGVDGIPGVSPSPAGRTPSPCFVLMQVQDGAWNRLHPLTPGTMDCAKDNLVSLVSSAGVGLVETPGSPFENEDVEPVVEVPESDEQPDG